MDNYKERLKHFEHVVKNKKKYTELTDIIKGRYRNYKIKDIRIIEKEGVSYIKIDCDRDFSRTADIKHVTLETQGSKQDLYKVKYCADFVLSRK